MIREAACQCGTLTLTCEGEPAKVSLCHCFDCQRRTGSLFGVAAFYPKAMVVTGKGEAKRYRRDAASGFAVTFNFCPDCGSNLWWEPERLPDLIAVAVGCFADRAFPMPAQAVWTDEQHHWLELPETLTAHARNPTRR
jgi:hypothetical protein